MYQLDLIFDCRFIIRQHNTVQLAQKNVVEMLEYLELQMGTKNIRDEIESKVSLDCFKFCDLRDLTVSN
jgi:hypothetical protein